MIYIAVDPGKSGAIAVSDGGKVHYDKMPENMYEIQDYFNEISKFQECICVIERLHKGMAAQGPRKGVKAIWSQAENYTAILCALYNAEIKTIQVTPQNWMGKMNGQRPKEYGERKSWLHEHAKGLYPELKSPKYAADALCILSLMNHYIMD